MSAAWVFLIHPQLLHFSSNSDSHLYYFFCNSLSSLTVCWSVFLPSQTFFPILFLLSQQISSHPAPARRHCEIQSSITLHLIRGINNTLFISNPAYKTVLVLSCVCAEWKKLEISFLISVYLNSCVAIYCSCPHCLYACPPMLLFNMYYILSCGIT